MSLKDLCLRTWHRHSHLWMQVTTSESLQQDSYWVMQNHPWGPGNDVVSWALPYGEDIGQQSSIYVSIYRKAVQLKGEAWIVLPAGVKGAWSSNMVNNPFTSTHTTYTWKGKNSEHNSLVWGWEVMIEWIMTQDSSTKHVLKQWVGKGHFLHQHQD